MFKATHRPATAVAWLVAVLGAGAEFISPITSSALLVEIVGVVTCLVASAVLAAMFFRR